MFVLMIIHVKIHSCQLSLNQKIWMLYLYYFVDGCIYALKRSKKPVAGSVDEYVFVEYGNLMSMPSTLK